MIEKKIARESLLGAMLSVAPILSSGIARRLSGSARVASPTRTRCARTGPHYEASCSLPAPTPVSPIRLYRSRQDGGATRDITTRDRPPLGARASRPLIKLLISLLLLLSSSTFAPEVQARNPTAKKKTYLIPLEPIEDKTLFRKLIGAVKHSETLPPIKTDLKVGVVYDETKLELPAKSRRWYKLPPFLAGTWESSTQKNFSVDKDGHRSPVTTVENHGVASYGKQRDKKGGIWDFVQVPIKVQNESEGFVNKDVTTEQTILSHSEQQLISKDVFTRRRVEKKTNKIVAVNQLEQISSITAIGKDKIELIGSMKAFDAKGNNLGQTDGGIIYRRTAPFKPQNFDGKEDLRPSFYYYLKKQGLQDLIPDNVKI